jgi:HSP20 family protein
MAHKESVANPIEMAEPTALQVDEAIGSMERLYTALTGKTPPAPGEQAYAPIPVERDAAEFVGEQIERLRSALDERQSAPRGFGVEWSPAVSVWEEDQELVLCLDLAGVRREDLRLAVQGNQLTVRGQRAAAFDGHRLRLNERPLGPFARTFVLPPTVQGEPKAQLREGVLEIRLVKGRDAAAERKEVPVR